MIRSQKPPYHGALLGMKVHEIFWDASASLSVSDSNILRSSSAADRYVDALSEINCLGSDFRLTKRRNANKKVSTVRSLTTSKCTARVTAHVKRQIYTLVSPLVEPLTYRGVRNKGEILEDFTEIQIEIRDPRSRSSYFSDYSRITPEF